MTPPTQSMDASGKTGKCLQCPELCKRKVITITIIPEGAAQSPFFCAISPSCPFCSEQFLQKLLVSYRN